MVVTGDCSFVDEVRIFNGNMKDIYMKAKLSIGDKFIHVVSGDVTVIYPTCNVTKIVIGKTK
jgi:hypothetical protein